MTITFIIGCFGLIIAVIGTLKEKKEKGIDVQKEQAEYELLKYDAETGTYSK
jgi:hypothetical protein